MKHANALSELIDLQFIFSIRQLAVSHSHRDADDVRRGDVDAYSEPPPDVPIRTDPSSHYGDEYSVAAKCARLSNRPRCICFEQAVELGVTQLDQFSEQACHVGDDDRRMQTPNPFKYRAVESAPLRGAFAGLTAGSFRSYHGYSCQRHSCRRKEPPGGQASVDAIDEVHPFHYGHA